MTKVLPNIQIHVVKAKESLHGSESGVPPEQELNRANAAELCGSMIMPVQYPCAIE
ncbi:hypothetical protein ACJ77P_06020 [Syntrophus buswellii]|jgi:hypothetical protein|uniref:hypothetical protein n=1 Tax=Syntrophus TaxID=43773 RepID=UPI00345EE7F5